MTQSLTHHLVQTEYLVKLVGNTPCKLPNCECMTIDTYFHLRKVFNRIDDKIALVRGGLRRMVKNEITSM